jgi:hypothetical protein
MQHHDLDELRRVAVIESYGDRLHMTRPERLERWAEVLESESGRLLSSLEEIERQPVSERPLMRAENSPLAVAFADPLLRAAGLASDRLGDAMAFFELSEAEAHRLLCSCLNGQTLQAGAMASRVRSIPQRSAHWLWTGLGIAGVTAGIPSALYLLT